MILLAVLHGKQKMEILLLGAVVQKTIISDFSESFRQNMHEKAVNKFGIIQRHFLTFAAVFSIRVPESRSRVCYRENTAVGNGDAVCIAAKIVDGKVKEDTAEQANHTKVSDWN